MHTDAAARPYPTAPSVRTAALDTPDAVAAAFARRHETLAAR
ncbi:hypothetical protein [Streptomyces flaveolus]